MTITSRTQSRQQVFRLKGVKLFILNCVYIKIDTTRESSSKEKMTVSVHEVKFVKFLFRLETVPSNKRISSLTEERWYLVQVQLVRQSNKMSEADSLCYCCCCCCCCLSLIPSCCLSFYSIFYFNYQCFIVIFIFQKVHSHSVLKIIRVQNTYNAMPSINIVQGMKILMQYYRTALVTRLQSL